MVREYLGATLCPHEIYNPVFQPQQLPFFKKIRFAKLQMDESGHRFSFNTPNKEKKGFSHLLSELQKTHDEEIDSSVPINQ